MRILDVESKTGLDRATIRFYEKEGFMNPARSENGYRDYCDEDVELLQKVKLLRQLGFSLDKIKDLQQGRETFSNLLSQQIATLNQQIQQHETAKQVCRIMQQEQANFENLNYSRYLDMLIRQEMVPQKHFSEEISRECHPWRRYFARMLDYSIVSALLVLIVVVILRVRPFSTNGIRVLNVFSYFISIPFLAIMQHLFGTTPGKWAMGIRIEDVNGGKLDFISAFQREFTVFCVGLGLNIPIISLWRLYKSYRKDTEGEGNLWNEETEIIFSDWTAVKKVIFACLAVWAMAVSAFSSFDVMLPKNRGTDITLSEFVENYHGYEKVLNTESQYTLADDGSWKDTTDSGVIVIIGDESHIRPDFTYQYDENGKILGVYYADSWDDAQFLSPVPMYCMTAMYSLLGSRPGVRYQDLAEAEELIKSEIYEKLYKSSKQGTYVGAFTVNDVKVSWHITAENLVFLSDMSLMLSSEEPLYYSIDFHVEIIQ
jgi:DNA-binding transcriptional MerR regulator